GCLPIGTKHCGISFSHVRARAFDWHRRWSPYPDRANGDQLGRLVGTAGLERQLARLSRLLLDAVDPHAPRPWRVRRRSTAVDPESQRGDAIRRAATD